MRHHGLSDSWVDSKMASTRPRGSQELSRNESLLGSRVSGQVRRHCLARSMRAVHLGKSTVTRESNFHRPLHEQVYGERRFGFLRRPKGF